MRHAPWRCCASSFFRETTPALARQLVRQSARQRQLARQMARQSARQMARQLTRQLACQLALPVTVSYYTPGSAQRFCCYQNKVAGVFSQAACPPRAKAGAKIEDEIAFRETNEWAAPKVKWPILICEYCSWI